MCGKKHEGRISRIQTVALLAGALPCTVLLSPGIQLFNEAMTIGLVYVTLGFVMLLCTLLLPVLLLIGERRGRSPALKTLLLAILIGVLGTIAIPVRSGQARNLAQAIRAGDIDRSE